jgi:hypothetical protein
MAEEGKSVDVTRISVLREYLASEPKSSTPSPFAEFRCFMFRKDRPTPIVLEIIKARLWKELERLEKLFQSVDLVKNRLPMQTGRDYLNWNNKEEVHLIQAREKSRGEMRIVIDGMEVEEISAEEVLQFFKGFQKRVRLNFIYRFVCFFDSRGNIKAQYDEKQIQELEAEIGAEAFFEETGEK